MKPTPMLRRVLGATLLAFSLAHPVHAQWLTQSFTLRPGWNVVHLHVNATHDSLENLVGADSPISEIWMWLPNPSEGRIVSSPSPPVSGSDWLSWARSVGPLDAFPLYANTTYLVRNTNVTDYAWQVKGKPVPPSVRWTASGLNFLGFPTRSDSPPTFWSFLSPSQDAANFEVFHYPGGEAADLPPNAVSLFSLASTPVPRGQAFWLRKKNNSDNRYFGPFDVVLSDYRGIDFQETLGVYSFRLRNQLTTANTVTATLLASEVSPTGESLTPPPLLLRTALDTTTLEYGFTELPVDLGTSFALAPKGSAGSEVEVVLGLDRANMAGPKGSTFAGILRLQDTVLGHLQVDLPVTATQDSKEGLWVGSALIKQVGNYLKTYARATNEVDFANRSEELNRLNEANQVVNFPSDPWTAHTTDALDPIPGGGVQDWTAIASSADGGRLVGVVNGGRIFTSADAGVNWTARESSRAWVSVASSADGVHLAAAVRGGRIYTSANAGASWTAHASDRDWVSVASSADGAGLVAAVNGGQIYTSKDAGVTWTARESNRAWVSVASSADGTNLVAAVNAGRIHTSADAGVTWTARESDRAWVSVASSADGTNLVAAVNAGQIHTSTNAGVTWTARESVSGRTWKSVASSADGLNLVAIVNSGQVYTSADAGMTWTARESDRAWVSVASSADGIRLMAAVNAGLVYTSTDGGGSWNGRAAAPNRVSIASSADGTNLVAAVSRGKIYTSADAGITWTPQPGAPVTNWLAVASSANGVRLLAAVNDGHLYTSSDSGTNWTERTGSPAAEWQAVASSEDGLLLAAVAADGEVYTSKDAGANWTRRTPVEAQPWQSIASSANGKQLVAAYPGGRLYASTNSGENWTALFGAPIANWQAVASSADGLKLVAAANPGGIYTSTDAGATWDLKASAPTAAHWQAVASSADGSALVAMINGGRIYTSQDSGKSWTAREEPRSWSAVASSADGTRLVAGENVDPTRLYTVTGELQTPPLVYDPDSQMILSADGKYLTASFDTALGDVPSPFPLRLIVHHGDDGQTRILQHVFVGPDVVTTNLILTLKQADLHPGLLGQARRISAVHLPLSGDGSWPLEGKFGGVGILNAVVTEGFDNAASNPFVHAYHPDHDNRDALFQPIGRGIESYDIQRQITLSFTPPGHDFASRTEGGSKLQGTYLENIVLKGGNNQTRTIVTRGDFALTRISNLPTLR